MRDIVLVEDSYSLEQAKENFPNHEPVMVSGNIDKEYEKLKTSNNVFIYRTRESRPFPHRNVVGMMSSRQLHSFMS